MMSVYQMGKLRVIDLSKPLDPATEPRRCSLFRFNTGGPIPDYHTHMDLMSHLGTHVEAPYHHNEDWPDVPSLPLTCFLGRAVYAMISDLQPNSHIMPADMEKNYGTVIKPGDIIILDSPYGIEPFTAMTNTDKDRRLCIGREVAEWFAENNYEDVCAFHDVLMAKNIVFLEVLKNLDKLTTSIFFMSYSPLPIKGLDSSPVRAYAIEGIEEFSK